MAAFGPLVETSHSALLVGCRRGCGVYLQNYVSSAIQLFFTYLAISPPVVSSFSKAGQCLLCPASPPGEEEDKDGAASMGSRKRAGFSLGPVVMTWGSWRVHPTEWSIQMAVIRALFVGCVATYLGNTPNTAAELDKAELRCWALSDSRMSLPFRSGLLDKMVITKPTTSCEIILEPGRQRCVQSTPPAIDRTQIPIFTILTSLRSLWSSGQTVILADSPRGWWPCKAKFLTLSLLVPRPAILHDIRAWLSEGHILDSTWGS